MATAKMTHPQPAPGAGLGSFNPSGDALRLLPPELWLQILLLVGLPKRHQLRSVSSGLRAVVDEHTQMRHLMISLGSPPAWIDDGEAVSAVVQTPVEDEGYEWLAHWTLGQPVRPAWMQRKQIQLLRLKKIRQLTDSLFDRLAQMSRLRSLWVYAPAQLKPPSSFVLDLARLRAFNESDSLLELRLDVPARNPSRVRLPSVRRLQLGAGDGNVRPLEIGHTFPNLERLACDVIKLKFSSACSFANNASAVSELRLFESYSFFEQVAAENVRRWLPRLRRLRLEAWDAGRLPMLAGFAGLGHLEYSSSYLTMPDSSNATDAVPDLRPAVARLQAALDLNATVVTLWGHRLREGDDQAELLHEYLAGRLEAAAGGGVGFPSAFDESPLDGPPAALLDGVPSAISSVQAA